MWQPALKPTLLSTHHMPMNSQNILKMSTFLEKINQLIVIAEGFKSLRLIFLE